MVRCRAWSSENSTAIEVFFMHYYYYRLVFTVSIYIPLDGGCVRDYHWRERLTYTWASGSFHFVFRGERFVFCGERLVDINPPFVNLSFAPACWRLSDVFSFFSCREYLIF